jgi:hypothetical protein
MNDVPPFVVIYAKRIAHPYDVVKQKGKYQYEKSNNKTREDCCTKRYRNLPDTWNFAPHTVWYDANSLTIGSKNIT